MRVDAICAFMAQRIGESSRPAFRVTRFGLFVTLEENGASGIVPLGSLPDDRWDLDEATQTVAGRRTRMTFTLGQEVEARAGRGDTTHRRHGVPPDAGAARARARRPRARASPPPLILLICCCLPLAAGAQEAVRNAPYPREEMRLVLGAGFAAILERHLEAATPADLLSGR